MKHRFRHRLESGETLLLDGGLASELESRGFRLTTRLWSAHLLLNNDRAIHDSHAAYIRAGADIVSTASYQATLQGLQAHGLTEQSAISLLKQSVTIALSAVQEASEQEQRHDIMVAASIGPYGAFLADGSEYRGNYGKSLSFLEDFHRQRIAVLDKTEADVLACETIPDHTEAHALNNLLKSCSTPSWISFSCRDENSLHDGTPVAEAAGLYRDNPNVLAVGVNCTNPEFIPGLIGHLLEADTGKHIIVYPNSGEQYLSDSKIWHRSKPEESGAGSFEEQAMQWVSMGADIVGGCCRVGPDEISGIRGLLNAST